MSNSIELTSPEAIGISGTNPRKHFPPAAMAELQDSIAKHGILQPLLVRPVTWTLKKPTSGFGWRICRNEIDFEEFSKKEADGPRAEKRLAELQQTKFLLVAGERRLRAARKVGLQEVPVLVRELSDKQALEIQFIENLQRSDLDPVEEAEGYEKLINQHGYSAEELAAKVGKSKAYIYARMKLAALCPAVRKVLAEGAINHSVALLIARIPDEKLQKEALRQVGPDPWRPALSEKRARQHIHDHFMLRLKDAPFDTRDADLVPAAGPCSTCPKRAGNQKELFADVQNADTCTDPTCFARKKAAVVERKLTEASAKGQPVMSLDQSKKVFDEFGRLKGDQFIKADERCTVLGYNWDKDWKTSLGKDCPPPILAADPKGELHELLPAAEARAALKARGLKPRLSAGDAQQRNREKRRKEFSRVAMLATGQILSKLSGPLLNAKDKRHAKLWAQIARAAYDCTSIDDHAFSAKRRGLVKSQTEARAALEKLLKTTTKAEDLIALTLELLLCARWNGDYWSAAWSAPFKTIATLAKVDLKRLGRQTGQLPHKKVKKK